MLQARGGGGLPAGGARMSDQAAVSAPPALEVRRWTALSISFTSAFAGLIVLLVFVPVVMSENAVQKLISLFILVILAVMWNALAGFGGLVSVGQQAFIGIGAYSTLYLTYLHNVNPFLAMLLASLFTGLVAIPISFIVLQLRGGAFAIGTWVIAEVAMILFTIYSKLGGGTGLSFNSMTLTYPDPHRRLEYTYWAALGTTAVLLLIVFALLRTRVGASLQAIRDDEDAAASVGVRVMRRKGMVFVLAALGCGAAGCLILTNQFFVSPPSIFSVDYSALMIFMVLVGGLGTFEGPIIGAIILFVIQNELGDNGVWYFVLLGAIAIGFALLLPRGLWGTIVDRFGVQLLPVGHRLERRRQERRQQPGREE
jgi:branched-chain amino acid transport system permease protein